jgi:RHS repeat-associated protein
VQKNYAVNTLNQSASAESVPVSSGNEHEISAHNSVSYTYRNDERLIRVTGPATYDLAYDALGRCVKRTLTGVGTTYYIYDGEKPIVEYNSAGTLVGRNLYGKGIDEILRRAYGNQTYYFQQDRNGNVTHLTNATRTIVEQYKYDAFGAPTIYNGAGVEIPATAYNNRFIFTGREYAATFGFYEYRARAYNPTLGRFMSEDPKGFDGGDYNLFRYCHNDPLDLTDPMGLEGEIYLYRDSADRSAAGKYVISENGKILYTGRANVNGFMKDDRGNQTRGIPKGDYTLQPKQADGVYLKGQPAITGRQHGLKPGQPTRDYKEDSVLVHEKGPPGRPDSRACVTCDREAVNLTKQVMDRNLDTGGTKFHVLEPAKAKPVNSQKSSSERRNPGERPDASSQEPARNPEAEKRDSSPELSSDHQISIGRRM